MKAAFHTPFDLQIEFLKRKLDLPTATWRDIWQSAHDRSFVVAGAMKADLLADLHGAVNKAAAEGRGIKDFRKDFRAIVAKHGWHGWTGEGTKAGEAWRTRVIYQTNLATSHAAGRWAQLNDPALAKFRPYLKYHHSDSVTHPRPHHVSWDGLVLPKDHPFWQTHAVPNGWGCRCWITAAGPKDYEAAKAAGKSEPPAGWDGIDQKTGAPVGIDKGWAYNPGASRAEELQRFAVNKAASLPPGIGTAFAAEVAKVGATPNVAVATPDVAPKVGDGGTADNAGMKTLIADEKRAFTEWATAVLDDRYRATNEFIVAGYLPGKVLADADVAALAVRGDLIEISDYMLKHGQRLAKGKRNATLPAAYAVSLPDHLEVARWLYDSRHNNVVAAFDIGDDARIGKAVVQFNYQRKGNLHNAVITTGVVDAEDMQAPWYREIK